MTEDYPGRLAVLLAERNKLADEVARLRARVRVEAGDVERAGVTRAHVEAWLRANGWAPSPREGTVFGPNGRGSMWRAIERDARGVELYERGMLHESINAAAYHFQRPGLDILDEMADQALLDAWNDHDCASEPRDV